MHGFIGIQALDLSRDTPSYLHSSNSLALCDTLVLGCHRVCMAAGPRAERRRGGQLSASARAGVTRIPVQPYMQHK
jgi:hypothetical protein